MGLFDELKKLTRPYSSEEYDEFGDEYAEEGKCFFTGKPSSRRVVFAKSY